VAIGIYLPLPLALPLSEVRGITWSVAKLNWRRFGDEKFEL